MDLTTFYRILLLLYPKDFRQEFSGEMLEVFHQTARERIVRRKASTVQLLLHEHFGLLRGATEAWKCKIIPKRVFLVIPIPIFGNYFPRPTAEEAALSVTELQQRHDEGRARMIQAAANGDFVAAYRHECEIGRLLIFLRRRNRSTKRGATGAA